MYLFASHINKGIHALSSKRSRTILTNLFMKFRDELYYTQIQLTYKPNIKIVFMFDSINWTKLEPNFFKLNVKFFVYVSTRLQIRVSVLKLYIYHYLTNIKFNNNHVHTNFIRNKFNKMITSMSSLA